MKRILNDVLIFFFCAFLLSGCNSVKTFNYRTSETVKRSVKQETNSVKELNNYALLAVVSGENEKLKFSLKRIGSKQFEHCFAQFDSGSFVVLLLAPGEYIWQEKEKFEMTKNQFLFLQATSKDCNAITMDNFFEKTRGKYLSLEVTTTDPEIKDTHDYFSNKVSGAEVFGHNFGKGIAYTILSPFYILYGVCWGLNHAGYAAMHTRSPLAVIAGALIYAFTFWAVPNREKEKLKDAFKYHIKADININQ